MAAAATAAASRAAASIEGDGRQRRGEAGGGREGGGDEGGGDEDGGGIEDVGVEGGGCDEGGLEDEQVGPGTHCGPPPCARSGSAGRRLPDQRRSLARVPHVRELEPRLMVLLRGGHQPRFACAIGHSS